MALVAGMTGPATAVDQPPVQEPASPSAAAGSAGGQRIQLVTGDHVRVDAKGRLAGFEAAKGRERIPVQTLRTKGHTLVIPADAQRLISTGKLDRRLFDLNELADPQVRKSHRDGLKLIVQYEQGASTARAQVRAATGVQERRTFPTINADAVRASQGSAAKVWEALTDPRQNGVRAAGSGIAKVWLDGVRRASLDRSVRQIGADKAWQAGYDGTGVKIAVLDTGVDKGHADLSTQVVGEKNFSESPDLADRVGHGTHVASIAAGTGAASGGKYKGVAPGAKILSGKVLNDEGFGDDSGILAGIEWAAAEGADVVNLSLGHGDTPEVDPLEAAVNRLSADKGILFAVAAGNAGEDGGSSLDSPGTADAALTVGAVNQDDVLAPFSSTGPRVGDGAVKPDVTAPGVAITAAAAPGSAIDTLPGTPHPAPGYLQIDGTSMATPHVAGAAAILKQRHPGWKSAELKGALTGSAKDGPYTAFQQGAGRVQADKALGLSVIADPVSLNFGVAQWPHADDKPVTRKVGYRNLGTADVTLDLTVATRDPNGKSAPAGFFTLGAKKVTVPAGGRAEVDLTADTSVGSADGAYSGYVTATGAGQSVRTAAAAVREAESYKLNVKVLGRDGADATSFLALLGGVSGPAKGFGGYFDPSSPHTLQVPKGSYALFANIEQDASDSTKGVDSVSQPQLDVNGDTTVTLDARTARPVTLTVPGDSTADGALTYRSRGADGSGVGLGRVLDGGFDDFRTAHVGPAVTDGTLVETFNADFVKDAASQYSVAFGGSTQKLATGLVRHTRAKDLATLKVGLGASTPGKALAALAVPQLPGASADGGLPVLQTAHGTRTLYVSTADGVRWRTDVQQYGKPDADDGRFLETISTTVGPQRYEAGRTYRDTFNTGVFGPLLNKEKGVFRTAPDPITGKQLIVGLLPLLSDGNGHLDDTASPYVQSYTSASSTLYRNGVKVAGSSAPPNGQVPFAVDSSDAEYRLTASIERSAEVSEVSTRVDADFTFRSKPVAQTTAMPVSTVRFAAPVDLASRAPAGRTVRVPVTVQGSAAGNNLKSLAVEVSYDDGKTWQSAKVDGGSISVKNPAKDKAVSFRAQIVDKQGNTSALTIHHAYYGK
ncbi:hypothetical protein GCM10010329_63210 [Streptomyces spiroverticillatus]|nr:hypothetical protein GCM10010329_63210 [Streptomyces spiroverticillatus]